MLQSETVRKYDTYKDSGIEWIGEIPKEWNTITLKRVFSNRDGGAWGEEPQNNENDRICIRIADFDYPKMTIKHDIDYTVRNYTTDVIEKLTLQKNDILIEKSGGGDQTPVGRTIIFNEDFNALYANFMDRLRVKQSISPKFIEYLLVSFYQNGITYQYIKQTTGIQNLDLTNLLAKESIVLPILDEQQKIADYLDKKCGEIDRVIETEKLVIEKLKEYKQSVITEAVTKGLDKSVSLKDSGIEWIGKIPQHWEIRKLHSLFNFIGGFAFKSDDYVDETENQVIRIGNIRNNNLILDDKKIFITNTIADDALSVMIKCNDILFSMTGTKGKRDYFYTLVVKKEYLQNKNLYLNQRVGCFRKKIDLDERYFNYLLKETRILDSIFIYETGTANQGNLGIETIRNTKLHFPTVIEQQQIADYLDKKCSEIDKAISDKEQVIEKFTEYKKSLIYECVTGKKRV